MLQYNLTLRLSTGTSGRKITLSDGNMSYSHRVNKVTSVAGQLGDLSKLLAVGHLSDLCLHLSFTSGVLGFLGSLEELLLDGVGFGLGLLDLSISLFSVVLSFLGFLLGSLNNFGSTL